MHQETPWPSYSDPKDPFARDGVHINCRAAVYCCPRESKFVTRDTVAPGYLNYQAIGRKYSDRYCGEYSGTFCCAFAMQKSSM